MADLGDDGHITSTHVVREGVLDGLIEDVVQVLHDRHHGLHLLSDSLGKQLGFLSINGLGGFMLFQRVSRKSLEPPTHRIQNGQSVLQLVVLLHDLLQLRGVVLRQLVLLKPADVHTDPDDLIFLQFRGLLIYPDSVSHARTHQLMDPG